MSAVIKGVTFAADVTAPVEVVESPDRPARWGWFANGLNVTPSDNRAAAYATAHRIASRRGTNVQIYADTGGGWSQVDVVRKPERELCEWWPERNEPATGIPGQGCIDTAVISVGATKNWHLCDSCAALPEFRRMSRRGRLAGYYAQEGKS